ncbi:hypothetical protein [Acidithiobacillus sp.]|uniref:hypothetical protein n=1 Tax=Acidithiobacillus sp. TaxID=1872118 RepID=UPI00262A45C5|nr:hypothetical protein [Acidithiobacillus sp.]MDD2748776.1 hypothetical protein [Acidithiobacillus sp.]MDD5280321.1 hypothetical protein [Acidithiobacillus sp.]
MRTMKLPGNVFNGLFHIALVASVDQESCYLLVDGLRELVTGLNEMMDANPMPAELNNRNVYEHDIIDIEHVILLMLEEARAKRDNIQTQCSLSQMLDELTAIKWHLSNRSQINSVPKVLAPRYRV